MPLMVSASETKNYTPAPEGTHQAVCVDCIDKGMHPNPFKEGQKQRKVSMAWQIDELRDDGKRYVLFKFYTMSLHEKATLRHDLESWRGRAFTATELGGFDLESVIGANCLINVQHKKSADGTRTYANVISVMPLLKGMTKIAPLGYERQPEAEREPDPEPEPLAEPVYEDVIPFAWLAPLVGPAVALGLLGAVLWA